MSQHFLSLQFWQFQKAISLQSGQAGTQGADFCLNPTRVKKPCPRRTISSALKSIRSNDSHKFQQKRSGDL